jgi:hypothetical protein
MNTEKMIEAKIIYFSKCSPYDYSLEFADLSSVAVSTSKLFV